MKFYILLVALIFSFSSFAQDDYLGEGPFPQLIIRGVTLISGDGAPPRGPIDIVVENNKIVNIQL